ncbi:MAG: hypothetical protein WD267_14290 [Balneolales bacterium]
MAVCCLIAEEHPYLTIAASAELFDNSDIIILQIQNVPLGSTGSAIFFVVVGAHP